MRAAPPDGVRLLGRQADDKGAAHGIGLREFLGPPKPMNRESAGESNRFALAQAIRRRNSKTNRPSWN